MSKKQITTRDTILNMIPELKKTFARKDALEKVEKLAASAFHSADLTGNTVKFYTSADKTGDAAFTMDFPVDMVLDQARTAFVEKFKWTGDAYPGSTNPSLENKPVMVLAVKGDGDTVAYSFLNMAKLVDTYTAKVEGKDSSTTVTVEGYEIDVKVNVSGAEGNILQVKEDGLYVPGTAIKVEGAAKGNLASFGENGSMADSGVAAENIITTDDIADYTAEEIAAMLAEDEPATGGEDAGE